MRSILKNNEGITDFSTDSINSRVTITLDNKKTSVEKIIDDIRKIGFKVTERIDSVSTETSKNTQKPPLNQ
ncbi:MAG: hypothetical protein JRC86_05355 [Deltaproteobacteria bacterium]|nr:hypothetical protein [Deltaproteobacteria bacterium]